MVVKLIFMCLIGDAYKLSKKPKRMGVFYPQKFIYFFLYLIIMDSKKRSITKSITWRIIGVIILLYLTWIFTGDVFQTGIITFIFNGLQIILYYLHERMWEKIKWEKKENLYE